MGIVLGILLEEGVKTGRSYITSTICTSDGISLQSTHKDGATFKFHPMCKKVRSNHLIFVDDLMIFYKGQERSVQRIMKL